MRYPVGHSALKARQPTSLATVEAVTEVCVTLLRIDVAESHARDRARRRRRDTENELERLDALRAVVEQDLSAFLDGGAESLREVAGRVASALQSGLRDTRAALLQGIEDPAPAVRIPEDAATIPRAVGSLFARCDLPDARWKLRWSAGAGGAPALAEAVGSIPTGVEATFTATIDPGEAWYAPRVDDCVGSLSVLLPDLGRRSLSRHVVFVLEQAGDRQVMWLARTARGGDAIEVVVRAPGQATPTVRRADEPTGISVTPEVAETLERLWAQVASGILARARGAGAVQSVTLAGADVRRLARPKALAAALLESIGSVVREQRRRGDIGALRERYADLPVEHRALFDDHGFESTGEIDARSYEVDEDAPTRRIKLRLPLPPG